MKKVFKNKINIFLLLILIVAGGFSIILNVEATDNHLIKKEETKPLFVQKTKFALPNPHENIETSNVQYVLRSTDENPLGYIDSTIIRCFRDMTLVDFDPRYKFMSYTTDVNGTSHRFYGFTIPLVGDLNGDGKPEIVQLGRIDGSTSRLSTYRYIYILNGQTGKEIVRYELPSNQRFDDNPGGYHGSPSVCAIVDADRNGKGEIIIAWGACSNNTYTKRVVSYEVNENTFNQSITDHSLKLTEKWISDTRYDEYGNGSSSSVFIKPIPQIVDINGDGVPEVVVYNKIYNATTGKFIMKLEELGTTIANTPFFLGSDRIMSYTDEQIGFPFIYDIDFDGKYDYIAGGKIYYDIDLNAKTYKTVDFSSSVGDGFTGVADINGDGKPEIVVARYTSRSGSSATLDLIVWTPNFSGGTASPEILAKTSFRAYHNSAQGNHSYIFIGDIDGKEQNGKKLPEVSILTSRPYLTSGINMTNIPVHPNVTDGANGGITASKSMSSTSVEGLIISYTWDNTPGLSAADRLKVSFMLEHDDRSTNTGFTLFDFDNDGVQDICYRDERTLRIISAKKSYISLTEADPNIIRFNQSVRSYTGYEYPVIADIDGDASADMIVMGYPSTGNETYGYIYAVEGSNGDLSPAPKVWNQYMYSPLKINEDLTTPLKTIHPLSDEYAFFKSSTDTEKTYIYNNTITQTTFYSVNESGVVEPIVRTPDAQLLDLAINMGDKTLTFKVSNIGDATINPEIPINIYANGNLFNTTPIGSGGLFTNETVSYSIPITDNLAVYTVAIGATIDASENMIPAGKYTDCNWADNMDEVASFLAKDDAATVIQYGTTLIDVLANDILQDECATQILSPDIITTPAGKGIMYGSFGSLQIVNNKLLYTAPKTYPGNVVELSYTLTCNGEVREAEVYIYIIESCSFGFASCAGSPYNVCIKESPTGIKFNWYNNTEEYLGDTSPNIPNLQTDAVYYVKPVFSEVTNSPYKKVQFPTGKIMIKALSSTDKLTAKWTGNVDTDWYNPANWVQVLTNGEASITWAPISCVNVVIPGGAENYPELTSATECYTIHMEDRAMIAGIHNLGYTEASVDFKPTATEKNRFVMWSAPLKDMFTGDYHFLNSSNQPEWGHVYMNFFQSGNPDYTSSVEKEKTFTSTFGSTGTALPLGKAFNVKVMGGREDGFSFPKTATSYTDANGTSSGSLQRTNAKRFITDGSINTSGELNLSVSGSNSFSLIQVVNPFMAYLDVNAFLGANSSTVAGSYSIWNGDVNAEFISVLSYEENDDIRYVIDDQNLPTASARYIAPLQSFFVKKITASSTVNTLLMNAATMTKTKIDEQSGSYVLRSMARGSQEPESLLRITATSGDAENSTVVLNRPGTEAGYNPQEDAEKIFNYGVPVSIYTLTNTNKALAINSSGTFKEDIKLGIRLKNSSNSVTLSFSGLTAFGHEVYLIDHSLGNKVIDLQKESSYSFTANSDGVKDVIELNNRFSLRVGSSPVSVEEIADGDNINIVVNNSRIDVSSYSLFNRVEVINLSGMKIFDNAMPTCYCQVPVTSGQVYIVRVTVGDKQIVRKIFAK